MQVKMWSKWVLIPLWIIEVIWLLVIIIFGAIALASVEKYEKGAATRKGLDEIAAYILIAMAGISLLFDFVNIFLFARHKLGPAAFLSMSCVKSIFWIFVFGVDIADAVRGLPTGLAFLFSAVLFATSVAQVIYGSVIMHRKRKGVYKRGNYAGVETGYRGARGAGSPKMGSHTVYNAQSANPFKDPSREPSPAASARQPLVAQESVASHPAFRKSGEAESYYNNDPAHSSFEMHNPATAYRDS